MPPVRVLFSHFTADVHGGSDRSLFDLVTHMPRRLVEPLVVLRHGDPLAPEYVAHDVTVRQMRLTPPRRAAEFSKQARFFLHFAPSVLRLRRYIQEHRAQVVHVNTINNLQGPCAAITTGTPLVWHVRELVPDSRLNQWQRRLVARWARIAVANSSAVAESLSESGDRVRIVFNGIDLRQFNGDLSPASFLQDYPMAAGVPVVTCLGRIEPWKGQHVLLDAFTKLAQRHPSAQLFFVGGAAVNKPDYERNLRERCAQIGLAERVHFTGIRRDVPAVLAATDVLVLPSVTPEPFGRTIVEAMAAGTPVVATRAGGPLDIIEDERTGLFAQPNNAGHLAAQIERILSEPELARALGQRGREVARERFALDRVVEEMAAIFAEAAQTPR